jgi:uncharacterized protein YodC (DUF2158 family)
MEQYNIGDVVELKSGGPKMTVMGSVVTTTGVVIQCSWFSDGSDTVSYATFPPATLRKST